MTEFDLTTSSEENDLPSYNQPGWILFELYYIDPFYRGPRYYSIDVLDADISSCVFWINEGMGIKYWIECYLDLELPGFYVVEGITGEYIQGDGWTTDDDEEWDFLRCRRATEAEISSGTLA